MPRKPKRYIRTGEACVIDHAFFARAELALGSALNDNARSLIAHTIEFHNHCCQTNETTDTRFNRSRAGRASDVNVHVFVDGLLDILEGEAGLTIRISKRQLSSDVGHPAHGPFADFMRVVHDALTFPDRSPDALARLISNCAPWLGANMADRRKRRSDQRRPRDEYTDRLRNAWKS